MSLNDELDSQQGAAQAEDGSSEWADPDRGARTANAFADAGDDEARDEAPDGEEPSPLGVLEAVTKERDDYLDSLRRLQADFENYRKRVKADTDLAIGRGTERVIDRLLPVLDTFEMALSHEADPDASPLARLHDQLLSALEVEGLERLNPRDAPFDPAEAEAVMHEEAEAGQDSPVVIQVLRAGYRWKGRVLRAAMVKVRG